MKEILGFHLNGCPYCANAFRAIDELVQTYGSTSTNNMRLNLVKAMTKQKH